MPSSPPPSAVLLVDDHAIIRRGLRHIIAQRFPKAVIVEASTCREILPAIARSNADLVLLDLQLSDGNAIDEIRTISGSYPQTRILVYSMTSESVFAPQALARGAAGFLSKAANEAEFAHALDHVLSGETYISPDLQGSVRTRRRERLPGSSPDPFEELSERELRVMTELLSGAGVKEIAGRLDLQPTTVATYKARLFDKLGVSNVLDLQRVVELRQRS